jgi:hypothetical protein
MKTYLFKKQEIHCGIVGTVINHGLKNYTKISMWMSGREINQAVNYLHRMKKLINDETINEKKNEWMKINVVYFLNIKTKNEMINNRSMST